MSLAVENLALTIAGKPILRGVSFAARAGEITALVGESGSGKSLTLLSAMRLLPLHAYASGSVKLGDEDMLAKTELGMCAIRGARIGMVFQEPMSALNPVRTIGAQIAETVRLHKRATAEEAMRQARAALDRVGLQNIGAERYPHELSGGQRQRVAVAIATVLKPEVLLADEPTTALDVITQAGVLDLFRSLARDDGAAIVLVTHDLALVSHVADRVAIMKDGAIVEEAHPRELNRLTHPYARALLAAAAPPKLIAAKTAPDAPIVAEVKGAGVAYRRKDAPPLRALDGVSLSIKAGESVGIVGESGSGKSTLARVALGLITPQSGAASIGGRDWRTARGAEERAMRRKAQIVFQDPYGSFDPRQRVETLVAEPLHLLEEKLSRAERRAKVSAMLERVGLSAADADKYPHQFSGGQRQRIAIARALITEPALVVLDEAVSALDVSIRAQILELLAELRARLNVAYLFITHDLAVVRAVSERVLIMRAGQVVEEGETEAVFANPRDPYTAALAAASPRLETA